MVGVIVVGHGAGADGLLSAAAMVAGERAHLASLSLSGNDCANFSSAVRAAIDDALQECGEVLVLADILGGTPFNEAMLAAHDREGVEVVYGFNLPMLIEVMAARDRGMGLMELVALAVDAGNRGIGHLSPTFLDATDGDGGGGDAEGI